MMLLLFVLAAMFGIYDGWRTCQLVKQGKLPAAPTYNSTYDFIMGRVNDQ